MQNVVGFRRKLLRFDRPYYSSYTGPTIPRLYANYHNVSRPVFFNRTYGCYRGQSYMNPYQIPVLKNRVVTHNYPVYSHSHSRNKIKYWKPAFMIIASLLLFLFKSFIFGY